MLSRNQLIMSSGQKVLKRPSTISQTQNMDSAQGQGGGGQLNSRNSMIQRSYKQTSIIADQPTSVSTSIAFSPPQETKGEKHRLQSRQKMQGIGTDILNFGQNNLSQISINNNLVSPTKKQTSSQQFKNSADRYREQPGEDQVVTSIENHMPQKELERRNSQFQIKNTMISSYINSTAGSPNKRNHSKYNRNQSQIQENAANIMGTSSYY